MTDKQLYHLCKKYGSRALLARRRFAGLLPEVQKRESAEKMVGRSWLARRGFCSIYEFAAKLAGMSRDQVDTVLRLDRKFEALPVLHAALVEGAVSANKLVRIAVIADARNQEELVKKAEVLSSRAPEVFVREAKSGAGGVEGERNGNRPIESEITCGWHEGNEAQTILFNETGNGDVNGSNKPKHETKSLHVQELRLAPDVENQLLEMQEKGIDVNAFLRKCLEQRKIRIEEDKEKLAQAVDREHEERNIIGIQTSRYIPAAIKKLIKAEHGTTCSKPNCANPAEQIHHEKLFSFTRVHDPRFLKPLCKAHHELEHAGEKKYQMRGRMMRRQITQG